MTTLRIVEDELDTINRLYRYTDTLEQYIEDLQKRNDDHRAQVDHLLHKCATLIRQRKVLMDAGVAAITARDEAISQGEVYHQALLRTESYWHEAQRQRDAALAQFDAAKAVIEAKRQSVHSATTALSRVCDERDDNVKIINYLNRKLDATEAERDALLDALAPSPF